MPRLGLAAGADPAPPRPRGALRLRLPDPARRRREVARRARRAARRTSPTCTPGPRSICPARAGSASIRPPACSPAKATSRSPARPSRRAPRRSPGAVDRVRGRRSSTRCPSTRVHESPRVTKPYTEEQWQAIDALGHAVDDDLKRGDVRLTMGGEPTFVSIDDLDGAEWNTTALGPTKRRLAGRAAPPAADALRAGGFAALRPGQVVSRRAAAALGARLLLAPRRRADLERPVARSPTRARPTATARPTPARFIRGAGRAARRRRRRTCMPGYEDVWYYLWRERRLPVNVDPLRRPSSRTRGARRACARVFEQGLDQIVGYALPLAARRRRAARWRSGPWFLRARAPVPHPGDSPMGYRLPLDSLPWASEADHPYVIAPRSERVAAAAARVRRAARPRASRSCVMPRRDRAVGTAPAVAAAALPGAPDAQTARRTRFASASGIVRTALCVEPRDGTLHVFMPPVGRARGLPRAGRRDRGHRRRARDCRCVIEGYTPPRDPRLAHFKVTPDPGVIEVNVHPPQSWDELVDNTDDALRGGAADRGSAPRSSCSTAATPAPAAATTSSSAAPTPADSPFLRRPDLLRSLRRLLAQPSVAVVPVLRPVHRPDEPGAARRRGAQRQPLRARDRVPRRSPTRGAPRRRGWSTASSATCSIDVTGNTHRAEFCIDKLYSPDSSQRPAGPGRVARLRDAAARADEPRAAAAAARAGRPVLEAALRAHAGALGHRAARPLHAAALRRRRISTTCSTSCAAPATPFEPAWFAPHFEFRFPLLGDVAQRGVQLELRQALEPWHVLGEEAAAGGTARYVDSSVERLQVQGHGARPTTRHVVTCNGRARAAASDRHRTASTSPACAIAPGSRRRACIPTIAVHAPLVFDLVDTWIGPLARRLHLPRRCIPADGATTRFPVNAYEAESRRRGALLRARPHARPARGAAAVERTASSRITLDLRTLTMPSRPDPFIGRPAPDRARRPRANDPASTRSSRRMPRPPAITTS